MFGKNLSNLFWDLPIHPISENMNNQKKILWDLNPKIGTSLQRLCTLHNYKKYNDEIYSTINCKLQFSLLCNHNHGLLYLPHLLFIELVSVGCYISTDNLVTPKIYTNSKVIHPKHYKHLKKGALQSHLGRQKMGWFLADLPVHQVKLKY